MVARWGELRSQFAIPATLALIGALGAGCKVEEDVTYPVSLDDFQGQHAGDLADLEIADRYLAGNGGTAGDGVMASSAGTVHFSTGSSCYDGEFTFRLPSRLDPATLPGVSLIAAFRGPDGATRSWSFEILNLVTDRYELLADTADANAGEWTLYDLPLSGDLTRYVTGNNRVYVRYGCEGSGGAAFDSQLDYLSLAVTDGNVEEPPVEEPPEEEPPVEEPPAEEPPVEEPPVEEPPVEEPPVEEPPAEDPAVEARIDEIRAIFDDELAGRYGSWESLSLGGANDSPDYYLMALPLGGVLSMFEATGDTGYLETALHWIENMISTAFWTNGTSSSWEEGYGWERSNGQSSLLDEIQAVQPMGRVARMVLTDPELSATYGARATAIRDWVDQNVLTKWMVQRSYGNYGSGWEWMLNTHLESPGTLSGYIQGHQLHAMRVAQNIYDAGVTGARRNGQSWGDLARQIAQEFASRLELQGNGSYLWDVDAYLWTASTTGIVDTSHSNKHPAAMLDLYEAGVLFDAVDMDRMARTLTRNIWNGRSDWSDPDALPAGSGSIWFSNYIDGQDAVYSEQYYYAGGSSHPHYGMPNGMSGMVYDGWCRLGAVDAEAQQACEALLDFIDATSDSVNAIRNRNGGAGIGTVALAGHLARNLRVKDW